MAKRQNIPLKKCDACGQLMLRKWYGRKRSILEQPTRYAKRQYCGNDCKARAYRKPQGRVHHCRQCDEPIRRKRYPSGEMETTKRLRARRFCDVACAALYYDEHGGRARHLLIWRMRNGYAADRFTPEENETCLTS